jgi:hypothetical protein
MNGTPSPEGHETTDERPWTLSVVLPVRDAATALERTLDRLVRLPGGAPEEILLVDRGPRDETWERLLRLRRDWTAGPQLVLLRSGRGLGAAYRAGVAASHGDRVLLTTVDLPFGVSDVEAVLACRTVPDFAIGSPAHRRSRVRRSLPHRVADTTMRVARRAVLGLRVGDTHGTFVLRGDLARRLVARTTVAGAAMTTELVALAVREGTVPVELPVVRTPRAGALRRRCADGLETALDLVKVRHRLRRRRRDVVVLPDDRQQVGIRL